jgi:polyphosphate kinase
MQDGENKYVLFLGDIVRIGLKYVFPTFEILGSYQIKMSRDSDLHIEDEFSGDLVKKIKEGLVKRTKGVPMRFLYDIRMPEEMLLYFKKQYRLTNLDLVPGGRYHSLNDFFSFPNKEKTIPEFSTIAPIPHPDLVQQPSILSVAHKKDVLLHYPYQPFDYVIQLIDEAARHPEVTDISITLYRVASDSKVIQALLTAAENGKVVTAFVELKARFNEADNLSWAEKMEKAGIKVLYSLPAVKVHAKLCLISFKKEKRICYFSTGNLNEKTAALYCDMGLITSDTRLTDDAFLVFHTLINKLHVFEDQGSIPHFQHLLVAPKYLRNGLYECIDNEIAHAKAGKQAHIIAKMNSLDDWEMIEKLYEASCAGVKIGLIIRGICCLIPGVAQQSENIQIRSIIGRYLEHARIAYFLNGGKEKIFLSSADWMRRNLDRRIEVAFPIYDGEIQHEIKEYLALQLRDNINTRIINKKQDNSYSRPRRTEKLVDAHLDMYTLLETIYHKRLTNTPKESGNKKGKEK